MNNGERDMAAKSMLCADTQGEGVVRSQARLIAAGMPLVASLLVLLLLVPAHAFAAGDRGPGVAASHQGLGPEVPVPSWAKGKPVHFFAPPGHARGKGGGRPPKVHNELGRRCEEGYCPSVPLEYKGGAVQHEPHAYVIFWGSNWNSYSSQRETIESFYNAVSGSPWQGVLTQYFDQTGLISHSVGHTFYTDTGVSAPSGVGYSSITSEGNAAIEANSWPENANAQYIVIPAPGTGYSTEFWGGGFCAYHSYSGGLSYTFVPYSGDGPFYSRCIGYDPPEHRPAVVSSMLASHEYAESATDPHPGSGAFGWVDSEGWENGDICASGVDELGSGQPPYVQGTWDNYQNQCSDSDSNPPQFGVVTEGTSSVNWEEATLQGKVNPAGIGTEYYFEYGRYPYEWTTYPWGNAGSGTGYVSVSKTAVGLFENSVYHYRLTATNGLVTWHGEDHSFTTPHAPPVVTTEEATGVKQRKATLHATINRHEIDTHYHFEYGKTTSYGAKVPVPDADMGSSGPYAVEQSIEGLQSDTTYHFRAVAYNSSGTTYGKDLTFRTLKKPEAIIDSPTGVGIGGATFHGEANPNEGDTTYRFEYVSQARYEASGFGAASEAPVPNEDIGSGSSFVEVGQEVTDLEPNTSYHVRLAAANEGGYTYSEDETFATERAYQPPVYALSFGAKGSGDGEVDEPQGIAVDPSGDVWVADTGNDRVQKFDSSGEYQCKIGESGSGEGQFSEPRGIAADSEGNVWVADTGNDRIQEIGSGCEYLGQVGVAGGGAGGLQAPRDVVIDPSGNLWVADSGNHRIEEFDSEGGYLASCGSKGTGEGQFEEAPLSIGTDVDGDVWAGDAAGRMEKFSSQCGFIASFDEESSEAPAKVQPSDFALDPEGNIWIPSAEAHDVQGFYPEGEYVTSFGAEGEEALADPVAIAAGPDGALWVLDDSESGEEVSDWVPGEAYVVVTGQATGVKRSEATLTGSIDPEGVATSYQFAYGKTKAFGNEVPASPKSVGSGTEAVAVSEDLDGLEAETTYYYHLIATTEEGTTYGETRHFTTLDGPPAGSQVLIGGKTFAELGIEEEEVWLEGSFTIKFMPESWPEYDCEESGTGTLVSTGLDHENVTLNCVAVGEYSSCYVQPIHFEVDGSFEGSTPWTTIVTEECGFFEEVDLIGPTGGFEYGSESKALNVTASGTTAFGGHEIKLSGNSHWQLLGLHAGEAFAVDSPEPSATTEAASGIEAFGATLNGTVNPRGAAAGYHFEYADQAHFEESGYATAATSPVPDGSAGSGAEGVEVDREVSGLKAGTTYHYRLVAAGEGGTAYGEDQTFTTVGPLNPDWRIEGSSLEELEAWEPYESAGTFTLESTALKAEVEIDCAESGSGTLGFEETIALSECETILNGSKSAACAPADTTIVLGPEFEGAGELLTTFALGEEECSIGEEFDLTAGTAFDFEAGSTAVELATAMSGGEVLFGGNEAQLSLSSTWALGGKYEGQKFAYAGDFESLNTAWRIEGSSLAELEAWEPYQSSGTLQFETNLLKKEATITCAESGSGTLGFEETINLSECEVELGGEIQSSCEGSSETPISLDGGFEATEESLTVLDFGEECSIGEEFELTAGTAFDFEAGSTAVELATAMSGGEVLFGGNEAQLSLSSTWALTGKYEGQKFAYAGDYSQLNPDWRIEGASLEELEAWEPYESAGTFTLESTALKAEVEIDCAESGSGTLGYEETIALSECETILNGSKSAACAPADTTIVLGPEFEGAGELLTTFALGEEEECPVGEDFDLTASTGFAMQEGSEAVEFPVSLSGGEARFGGNEANVSFDSTWQLTGVYAGGEFGYL